MEEFEHSVMSRFLAQELPAAATLRAQYDAATITRRELTGVGFFTEFSVPTQIARVTPPSMELHAGAELVGVQRGVGFVLFVRNGSLTMLEGFTYDEAWPERPLLSSWDDLPRESDRRT